MSAEAVWLDCTAISALLLSRRQAEQAMLVGGLSTGLLCCLLIRLSLAGFKNEEPHCCYSVKSVTFVLAALRHAGNVHVSS